MRFFDASALVKRYVRERGTRRVGVLLRSGAVVVSRLSELEVSSALARLTREAALPRAARDRAMAALTTDMAAWTVVEVTPDVVQSAREALVRHPLRAGDAAQLGAAQTFARALGEPLRAFVVSDERLAAAARSEGLVVDFV